MTAGSYARAFGVSGGTPSAPTISGTVLAGNTLTITPGGGGGTVSSYTLYRSGVSAGTVSSGYTFVAADIGTITVRAVGPGGTSSDSNSLYSHSLSSGGTFARASAAYYYLSAPTDGSSAFLASASSGTRRSADTRGDGIGASLLMEKSATNKLLNSRDLTSGSWGVGLGSLTSNANGGVDGATLADRIVSASGQYGWYQITGEAPSSYAISAWARAVSGSFNAQIALSSSAINKCGTLALTIGAYGRITAVGTTTVTSNAGISMIDGRDLSAYSGGQAATAQDAYVDLLQLEAGYYPTSPIVTAGAAVTRSADTLSYASGAYPVGFLTSGVVVVIAPDASSAEIVSANEDWRLVQVGANDYVRIRATAGVCKAELVCGGSVVAAQTFTFSHAQALTITAKPSAGSITVAGATTGNGTTTGSGAAWASSATLYVGGDNAGANNVTGRFVGASIAQAA